MGFMLRSEIQIEAEKCEQDENNSQQEPSITERTHSPPVQPIETSSLQKKNQRQAQKMAVIGRHRASRCNSYCDVIHLLSIHK